MAQAQIENIKREDIIIEELTSNKITCRIGIGQTVIIQKVKGEPQIILKEEGKTIRISKDYFGKILKLCESFQLIVSFLNGAASNID